MSDVHYSAVQNAWIAMLFTIAACLAAPAVAQATAADNFTRLSQQADQARESNDLERAVTFYRQALVLRPRWAAGWWSLGTIYYDRSAYPEAARAFERLLAISPKHGTGHAMLGLCQFEMGRDDAALRHLSVAREIGILKDDQLRHVVLYHQGLLFLRKNKFSSAEEALKILARDGVREESATLALGMAVLLVPPANLPAEGSIGHDVILRAGQAEMLAASKQVSEARKTYLAAIEAGPDFPNLHYAFGRMLLGMDDTDDAIAQFQKEIRVTPKHVQARLEIAAVRYRTDSASGVPYAEEAVSLDPHLPFGHYLLGILYADTGQYEKAVAELEIAKKSFAHEPEVYFALGNVYARLGRKAEAARARAEFRRLAQNPAEKGPATYGKPAGIDPRKFERQDPSGRK